MTDVEVVSLLVNALLVAISLGLVVDAWKERQRRNSQVKIWMEQANGVSEALLRIIRDKWNDLYSDKSDITNAVNSVQASAFSLYQSLYDERVLTEKEYKAHAMKIREVIDKELGLTKDSSDKELQNKLNSPAEELKK